MQRFYLIQRAEFYKEPLEEYRRGLTKEIRQANKLEFYGSPCRSALLDMDYMGSAEFEWGALPKSLIRMYVNLKGYTFFKTDITDLGQPVWVFGPANPTSPEFGTKPHMDEIVAQLKDYLEDAHTTDKVRKYHLKEYISFGEPSNDWRRGDTFWWDIQNDFMFFLGDDLTKEAVEFALADMWSFMDELKKTDPEKYEERLKDRFQTFGNRVWRWWEE